MGSGIAEVAARAGCDVLVAEADEATLAAGRARVEHSIANAVKRGKLDEAAAAGVSDRLRFVRDLDPFEDRQLVVEAVSEDEDVKVSVFRALDEVVGADDAVLASNTSSIPIMKLAMATHRPDKVIGLHFFNPVPVLALVEVVPSLLTSDDTAERVESFANGVLGKNVIRSQDRAGFIVNALLIPYILSAIRMMESGFASAEDIDMGMVQGCAHPMGPLALADLIGLDTVAAIADSLYAEFKEPLYSAPPLLMRMVDAGLLGRKSGRGFSTYER
jgi:3-hydroxybutyryl-CoA dehydrogenase